MFRSHPSWMRGLKHQGGEATEKQEDVASLVDAWIETLAQCNVFRQSAVASLVDAWIETRKEKKSSKIPGVASLVDAWIETFMSLIEPSILLKSHPSWMRGLKPI